MRRLVSMTAALALLISTTSAGVPGGVSAANSAQVPVANWPPTIARGDATIVVYPPQAIAW